MVDSINPNTVAPASFAEAAGGNKSLDQDAFLRLFVAQLRNQDPLNPQQNHEFVAQLAQFSSLEQTVGINERLDQLTLQNRGLQNSETVGLVGKNVEVRGNIVSLDDQDVTLPVSFTLDKKAETVSIAIKNAEGRTVRTVKANAKSAGLNTVHWDGRTNEGLRAPEGPYAIEVTARDGDDRAVNVSQNSTGIVQGVSFEQGFPLLHLDSGLAVPIADLLKVSPPPNTTE